MLQLLNHPFDEAICYGLNICVLPNSYIEAPAPSVDVFGDWSSVEVLQFKGGQKTGPGSDRINVIRKKKEKTAESSLSPLPFTLSPTPACASTKEKPRQDLVRRWPSASQEKRSQQKPNQQNPDLRILASRTVRKLSVCCLWCSVMAALDAYYRA